MEASYNLMRLLICLLFIALIHPALIGASGGPPPTTIRFHTMASELDTDVFAIPIGVNAFGQPIYIEKLASITERNIINSYFFPAEDGSYGAAFKLDPHATLSLEAVSIENRGQFLFVLLNGQPATQLFIDERVSDGIVFIPNGFTREQVDAMELYFEKRHSF